ncbi:hypothetical protein D3C81_2014560 [compost metagenome]
MVNMLSRFSPSRIFISRTIRSIGRYTLRDMSQEKARPPTKISAAISRVALRMLLVCLVMMSYGVVRTYCQPRSSGAV